MSEINNKSQASNYLYMAYNNIIEADPATLKRAEEFFSEAELLSTSFAPLHDISDCFPGVAKKCGIGCECES